MYATVVKSRSPEGDNELDLCVGDKVVILNQTQDGWMKGVVDDNVGVFPADCVRMLKHLFSVQVNYRYESQLADELELSVGDVVSVLDDQLEDDGWWFGQLNSRVGVFPNNFVEVIQPVTNKPIIRKKSILVKHSDSNTSLHDSSPKHVFHTNSPKSKEGSGGDEGRREGRNEIKEIKEYGGSHGNDVRDLGGMGVFEGEVGRNSKRGVGVRKVSKDEMIESKASEGEMVGIVEGRDRGGLLEGMDMGVGAVNEGRRMRGGLLESRETGGSVIEGREVRGGGVESRKNSSALPEGREIGGREIGGGVAGSEVARESKLTRGEEGGSSVMEDLAKVRFNFEWFSMRHARVLSQLVDEVEAEKRERKVIEQDLLDLRVLLHQRFPLAL